MLLQIFDEKECTYKEEISDLKTQLEEGRKIEEGMRKQCKEIEDEFQKLKVEANSAREELHRIRTSAQETRGKPEKCWSSQ